MSVGLVNLSGSRLRAAELTLRPFDLAKDPLTLQQIHPLLNASLLQYPRMA
jgi:hypothetical protein